MISFQNPSIEEFVERKVLFDPYALASVAKAVATVSQARTVLKSVQNSNHDSASMGLWATLREKGKSFNGKPNGRLRRIIFGSLKTPRTYWSRHRPAAAEVAQVQLAIKGAARIDDEYTQHLREKVLTTLGWQAIVNELAADENVVYSVLQLQKWIAEDSGWVGHDKMASERCLREAAFGLLADHELPVSWIETVVVLYRAVTTVSSDLPDELRNRFQHLATRLVEIIPDITDEPDIVRAEADSLREFGELMSWPVESMYEKLVAEANALEGDPEDEEDQNVDRLGKSENASDRFDIDGLFEGLLDRC
ncbi:hypothetical protein [Thiorhodococcus minor]|uniref:Uncharacterized protein n=1 Tax=Thiorhodococcus minor TaxID=57489 RepID=A0A6M0K504_9GAMM|nr:hypothetical protein [Thiorhodococcus minor]NEV64509.1 hypothetical protein [Thiorhodococcus minor]